MRPVNKGDGCLPSQILHCCIPKIVKTYRASMQPRRVRLELMRLLHGFKFVVNINIDVISEQPQTTSRSTRAVRLGADINARIVKRSRR